MKINQTYKSLLLEGIHPEAKKILQNQGVKVEEGQASDDKSLIQKLQGFQILGSRSQTRIDKNILQNSKLLSVGAFCIGVNQIDLKTACEQGVAIFNAPYSNTRSVAEMVIGFIVMLSRKLFYFSQKTHQGHWEKTAKGSLEVRGKTLGIIGYGHIGSQVSVLAEALGMKILYYDIVTKLPLGNAQPTSSMQALLKESDFVTIHVPETPETINLIGEKELKIMKKGAQLINTSRGTVVCIKSLVQALDSEHLTGAALDVFPQEPKTNKDLFQSPLQNKKRVILTPHVGGSTEEAQKSIGKEVSQHLLNYIFLGSTEHSVNFPQLHLPVIPQKAKRITNIHKNQPGVLSQINNLVSQLQINIKNQYLTTNDSIGYLVMDVERDDVKDLGEQMSKLKTSIKTRVLP